MVSVRTANPVALALTLEQAKRHLKEDLVDADNDADIEDLIQVATMAAEDRLGRTLVETTWMRTLAGFPPAGGIVLHYPPILSVESVRYVDQAGALQTMAPAAYLVDPYLGQLQLLAAAAPAVRPQSDAVRITYKAGFASPDQIPRPIVQWIKLALTDLYQQRARSSEKPVVAQRFADSLLDTYNIWRV